MKKSNTEKKGGERQGKEHHTYKKKKIIPKNEKGKMWKKKLTLWFDKFSQRQQTFPGEFFPDDLYHAHPLFLCTSCQPQSRGDEKSYRCSLPNENIVVRGFSLIFSRFFFPPVSPFLSSATLPTLPNLVRQRTKLRSQTDSLSGATYL